MSHPRVPRRAGLRWVERRAPSAKRRHRSGVLIGFAAGWAVVTEYPAAVPGTGPICLFAAWQVRAAGRDSLIRVIAAVGVGLAIAAIVLLAYNTIAFGAPLHVTYSSEVGSFEEMKTGLFGIGLPRLDVLWDLLFGVYRGLIPLAPILVFAPMGFSLLWRAPATRPAALVAGAVAAFYFLISAAYAYWSCGWSNGSRHVGPALPFLALAVAPLWQRTRTEWRAIRAWRPRASRCRSWRSRPPPSRRQT